VTVLLITENDKRKPTKKTRKYRIKQRITEA
jgi:hypothetical protein